MSKTIVQMSEDEMHRRIVRYAGHNYAAPEVVTIESINLISDEWETIDDLINALVAFRKKHAPHAKIYIEYEYGGWDSGATCSVKACRLETLGEVESRIEGYRQHVIEQELERRRNFERMKQEYEPRDD